MDFVAEIHAKHDDLAFMPTISSDVDVTLRWEYDTAIGGEYTVRYVSVFGDVGPQFDAALEADHTVADATRLTTFSNRSIYRVRLVTDLRLVPEACLERGAFLFRLVSDDYGWIVRLHLPDRDALLAFNEHCLENDISFRVDQLYQSDTIDEIATVGLSEQQRDILLTALYAGYYDIPRNATQADIAEQLEVSTSAISQRLRRAVARLIVTALEQGGTSGYP